MTTCPLLGLVSKGTQMPSSFPSSLKTLLTSGWCKSYPALDLILKDGTPLHYSTTNITAGSTSYIQRLEKVGSLKLSLTRPADRCEITIDNVDGAPGQALVVPSAALTRCRASLSRIYVNLRDANESYIVRRLTGIFQTDAKAEDTFMKGVVLSDIYAAGMASGTEEVKDTCTWVYKDPDTCTYAGSLTSCDFHLDGPNGCIAHHGEEMARARFGGNSLFIDDQTLTQFSEFVPGPGESGGGRGRGVDGNPIDGPRTWRIAF